MDEKSPLFSEEQLQELERRMKERERQTTFKFPLTVTGVGFEVADPITHNTWRSRERVGDTVAVRSCKKEHGDRTRLGILVGFVPIHSSVRLEREEGKEDVGKLVFEHTGDNPAIFVPELREVVLGCECWWGRIKDESELRQITDGDIQNVWYVKALKELAARDAAASPTDGKENGAGTPAKDAEKG